MNQQVGTVTSVNGGSVAAHFTGEAAPGLTFSRGHAYYVGQVGAFVKIPLGLASLFGAVVEVGSTAAVQGDQANGEMPRPWMRIELLGETSPTHGFRRGIAQYPTIGDRVDLVTSDDLWALYGESAAEHLVAIGSVANAPEIPALLDANRLLNRHAAIVGSTGSGKSTTVAALAAELAQPGHFPSARIILLDLHGEYGKTFGDLATVFDADVGATRAAMHSQLRQRMSVPYWALPFEDFCALAFGEIDSTSAAIVQEMIGAAKRAFADQHPEEFPAGAAKVTADTPAPFSVRQLWYALHEEQFATHTSASTGQSATTRAYQSDTAGNPLVGDAESLVPPTYVAATQAAGASKIYLSGTKLTMGRQVDLLGSRLRDSRFDFIFRPGPWDVDKAGDTEKGLDAFLETWLGATTPIVVVDLSAVPSVVLDRIVAAISRILLDALVWARRLSEGAKERPLLFILEEAHRYLSGSASSTGAIVERIAKEGRKFGIGLLVVSQRPSEIPATVLSQLGTFVVMRLSNANDRAAVRATLPDNLGGLFDTVPILRTGEALATGDAVQVPMRILIRRNTSRTPDSSDPLVAQLQSLPGGWIGARLPQDFGDVSHAWRHLTTASRGLVPRGSTATSGGRAMDRELVKSTNLVSVGYDASASVLEVEFKGGRVYQYFDVPPGVHAELMAAESPGSYHSEHIRYSYRYTTV